MTEEAAAESSRRSRMLLAALASCRARKGEPFDPAKTDASYAAAFREFGITEQDNLSAPDRIKASADPAAILSALDEWSWLRRVRLDRPEAEWTRPMKIAERTDDDPWRRGVRTAALYGRKKELLVLAGTDPSALPPDSARLSRLGFPWRASARRH